MNFSDSVFKAYDIRGLVATELSPELAYRVGRAFVQVLRSENMVFEGKKLVVGYDMRPTSPEFKEQVIQGFLDEGVDVVDIGMCSTPLFNFACAHFSEHAGGIMVTASHNPAPYNGFKLTRSNGLPIGKGSGMETIRDLVQSADFPQPAGAGERSERDIKPEYFEKLFSLVDVKKLRPLTVVFDYGNGMGSVTFRELVKKLPITVHSLYEEPDGNFPNHEANPLKVETLSALQEKVKAVGADFGFALDGDADRIGLVDETGAVVPASFVGTLLGLEVLRLHPGLHMMYNLNLSQIAREIWEKNGATTQMCMNGHALIKNMMKQVNAGFACELSLHVFYGDLYNLESGDLSLLYFLQLLSREQKSLSQLIAPLNKYFHSGEMNFEVHAKDEIMQKIEFAYKDQAIEVSSIDGVWMRFDWGWFSVRKSNTEPVLRLNLEARSLQELEEKKKELVAFIQ